MAIERVDERDWLFVLTMIPGLGRKRIREIYETFGSFAWAVEEWEEVSKQFKLPPAVLLEAQKQLRQQSIFQQIKKREMEGVNYLCFLDDNFPQQLRHIPDPPLSLFYQGDIDLLHLPAIGVVGSRKPTPYGRACCAHLVKELAAAGLVIVSGMAYGIDGEAHQAALKAGGKTIGVLGCGIDQVYPERHRALYKKVESQGLLLSEHPPGTPPVPGLFPERNRIISGLSLGVLVIEAAEKSGSLITADCALEQGRDVFAVPGTIFSSVSAGPHNLIKQGAKLVTTSEDVLEEWDHLIPREEKSGCVKSAGHLSLDDDELAVWTAITHEGIHADQLRDQLGPNGNRSLHQTLIRLEAKGVIASLPGGYFARR